MQTDIDKTVDWKTDTSKRARIWIATSPPTRPCDINRPTKSAYLNDMMAFADLLAACNVVHEAAVYEPEDYDGEITLRRIAEAHRRLVEDCNHPQTNA